MRKREEDEVLISPWIGLCCLLPVVVLLIMIELPPDNHLSLVLTSSSIIVFTIAVILPFFVVSSKSGRIVQTIRKRFEVLLVFLISLSIILIFASTLYSISI